MSVQDIAVARVSKAKDSTEVKPVDLLRAVIHDIETGQCELDGLIVLTALRPKDGPWKFDTYRANVTYDQQIVLLEMEKERTIRRWREA